MHLKVDKVTLGYGPRTVLREVSLEVRSGEMLGLIGPNGSGKSTLIKAIGGLLAPRAGGIALDGRDIHGMSRLVLARTVAVVPQNAFLPESFSALDIVLMGRYPHLGFLRFESQRDVAIALAALESAGLGALAERAADELSGGERQRLLIARALAQETRVLLLDEPTANLDIQHQLEVMEILDRLAHQGVTVLVSMHDFSLAARFCHRLLLLNEGAVRAEGPPEAVLTTANLQAAFGVRAVVYKEPGGERLIINAMSGPDRSNSTRVHVIGGGGRGARALQMLHAGGFKLTAGVLNEGDADLAVAAAVCEEVVAVPPFAAIGPEAHRRNRELVALADWTVVCDMPFGQANLLNLEAAAAARRLVLIEDVPIGERDFTRGTATAIYERLKGNAVMASFETMMSCLEREPSSPPWRGRVRERGTTV